MTSVAFQTWRKPTQIVFLRNKTVSLALLTFILNNTDEEKFYSKKIKIKDK